MARYRATATLVWDLETQLSPEEAQGLVTKQLEKFPTQDGMSDMRLVVRLDKLKQKIEKVKLGEFSPEDVIPYITKDDVKRDYEYGGIVYPVRMNSHRYFIFRECMTCVACGLQGTKLFLECHPADKSPHFNLYGEEDGKLVLFTKDHIHAKAFGGEDRHSNYQTMCLTCNNLKGHSNLTLDAVRELRAIYNENKNKVTKKKLHLLVEEARTRLAQPWPDSRTTAVQRRRKLARQKASADALLTTCDINLYFDGQEIYGKSVYDTMTHGHKHVGCIRKGTCLEPLVASKEKVMCKLGISEVVMLNQSLVRAKDR